MKHLREKIQAKFNEMAGKGKLFRTSVSGQEIWDKYLSSFNEGDDPVFRDPESSFHNCNHCKNFILRYGNIVAIGDDNSLTSMFDIDIEGEYSPSTKAMAELVRSGEVVDIFIETENSILGNAPNCTIEANGMRLGIPTNTKRYTREEAERYGGVTPNQIVKFEHFSLSVSDQFLKNATSKATLLDGARMDKVVLMRALDTIPLDTLNLVRDLINQNSLLDATQHLPKVEAMIGLAGEYTKVPVGERDNWVWLRSHGFRYARFRNELIGTLCVELSEGKNIEEACTDWNKRVDPINYMRATRPITENDIRAAKKFVEGNGYAASFKRRLATLSDIKVTEIQHLNAGDGKLHEISIFDGIKPNNSRHKRAVKGSVEEIPVDKFISEILPSCTSVEAFIEKRHFGNLMTLTTTSDAMDKPIFKWDNGYSWTFNGNLAGKSMLRDAVKNAGGKISGALRFSIMWNEDGRDIVDLDVHAKEPDGTEIYFGRHKGSPSKMSGMLDVDMIRPDSLGVENIVWSDINKMKNGRYTLTVNNYDSGRNKGFKAEVEFNGNITEYHYAQPLVGRIDVAVVTLTNGTFTIESLINEANMSGVTEYRVTSGEFRKVRMICPSPNHWGDNRSGNKFHFFFLEDCKVDRPIRSFHVEHLKDGLREHRRVLDTLGLTTMIDPGEEQLSGLGFNSTVRDNLTVKLKGSHERMIKIMF